MSDYLGGFPCSPLAGGPIALPSGLVNLALVMPCEPGALEGMPTTLTTMPGASVSFVHPCTDICTKEVISTCHSIF